MTLPNYPSPEVKKFGERVNEAMQGELFNENQT